MRTRLLAAVVVLAPLTVLAAAAPTTRTVYVTVQDGKGTPAADLSAADFTLKEGGKDREIVKVEPATTKMTVAMLVEDRLVADGSIRVGLFEFAKRLAGQAETALITVGMRNEVIVDYTEDLNTLVRGLNNLSLNPNPAANFTEGVLSLAKDLEQKKPERPVIVALALSGGQSGGPSASNVLTQLRQSRATMFTVSMAGAGGSEGLENMGDAAQREQVLGDGPKQSGGRRYEVTRPDAFSGALQQVAGDLLGQYAITYTLPDGVKPDRRLNVSLKRRGLTLRAPSAIADR